MTRSSRSTNSRDVSGGLGMERAAAVSRSVWGEIAGGRAEGGGLPEGTSADSDADQYAGSGTRLHFLTSRGKICRGDGLCGPEFSG